MPSPSLSKPLLLATLLLLCSCAQKGPASPQLTLAQPSTRSTLPTVATEPLFCAEFSPIQWSTRDTDLTKQQVQADNAKFHALCSPP